MISLPMILLLVAVVALLRPVLQWHRRFVEKMLLGWAGENHYEVVHWQWRPFVRGPFMGETFNAFNHTEVFRVVVRDRAGVEHEGWVCCYLPLMMLASTQRPEHVAVALRAVD